MKKIITGNFEIHHELISGLTHLIWAGIVFLGMIYIGHTAQHHGQNSYWPVMTFMATMFFTFLVSGTYHVFPHGRRMKDILQRVDHALIYFLIVGTHHAIVNLVLRDENSLFWLKILWTVAFLGALIKLFRVNIKWWLSVGIYMLLGLIAVVKLDALYVYMEEPAFYLLIAGGACYLIGVIFYVWEELRGKDSDEEWLHVIFHIFIILGSAGHFLSVLLYLFQLGPWINPGC